jgi:hypothetical protein
VFFRTNLALSISGGWDGLSSRSAKAKNCEQTGKEIPCYSTDIAADKWGNI